MRAQNEARRLAAALPGFTLPVTGALSFESVAALYFARPFAVSPPFRDFSPRPSDNDTLFFGILGFFALLHNLLNDLRDHLFLLFLFFHLVAFLLHVATVFHISTF